MTLPTKLQLEDMYQGKLMSTKAIGMVVGMSQMRVIRLMKKMGIARRAFTTKGLKSTWATPHTEATKQLLAKKKTGKKLSP